MLPSSPMLLKWVKEATPLKYYILKVNSYYGLFSGVPTMHNKLNSLQVSNKHLVVYTDENRESPNIEVYENINRG